MEKKKSVLLTSILGIMKKLCYKVLVHSVHGIALLSYELIDIKLDFMI